MMKTFTLPRNLKTQMRWLTDHEPCELLYRSQLLNFLSEEFEGVSFSPDRATVDKVIAYSRAVEARHSATMRDDYMVVLN